MTRQRILKILGIVLAALVLLITIIGLALGYSSKQMISLLAFTVPTVLIIGGVFYFFGWLVFLSTSKSKGSSYLEAKVAKGYVSYLDRKKILDNLPKVKRLWLALMACLILSAIYGTIVAISANNKSGFYAELQKTLDVSLPGLVIGSTIFFVIIAAAMQLFIIGAIYRLERWMLYLLVGSMLVSIFPPLQISAIISNILILASYYYILKKVYAASPSTAKARPITPTSPG